MRLRARRKRQDPRTEKLLQSIATDHDEYTRHCFVCSVPSDRCCVACSHPVCHDCSHKTLCTRCTTFFPVLLPLLLNQVNIVEEEQNMWRRIKKGTKFQLDAGHRSALLLSSQRVKPHFVAESLITSTVKDALGRTPRETFPATTSQRSA